MSETPDGLTATSPRIRSITEPGELLLETSMLVAYSSPRIWKDGRHVATVYYDGDSDACVSLALMLGASKVMLDGMREISGILTVDHHPTVTELSRIQKICSDAIARATTPEQIETNG